jgi:hypothetical protein
MDIDEHRRNPEISIDRHVKSRVVELGRFLDNKQAIYLDLRFWILLRKALLAGETSGADWKLLKLLRQGVRGGKIFCPISETVFFELLKQSDESSRLRTARLMDELSLGVTLLSQRERIATELAHFLYSFDTEAAELCPLKHLVWSKLSYLMGFTHPTETAFDAETELAAQKAFFDKMWTIDLAQMVEMTGARSLGDLALTDIADKLNAGNTAHAVGIKSFKQVWLDELRGAVDLCVDTAADIIAEIAEKRGVSPPPHGSEQWNRVRSMCANVLFYGLKAKPGLCHRIPTLYIEACLHAAVRWDKSRPLSGNDIYDFQHASAAVAHCQAFLHGRPVKGTFVFKATGADR